LSVAASAEGEWVLELMEELEALKARKDELGVWEVVWVNLVSFSLPLV
jgi:hypothetical protein